MSKGTDSVSKDEQRRRDELLTEILKTPPQPRPKRERHKSVVPKGKKPNKKNLDK